MRTNLYRLAWIEQQLCMYESRGFEERYRWTQPKWEQMWDSIKEAYQINATREGYELTQLKGSFLGHIVLRPIPLNDMYYKYILVDGLQRLVTLAVVKAAVRDRINDSDPELARYISSSSVLMSLRKRPQLLPTGNDQEILDAIIVGGGKSLASEHSLAAAYRFFEERIKSVETEYKLGFLNGAIANNILFAVTEIEDDENDETLFRRLNCQTV